ncbi:hypothetical protein DQ384_39350, partial [Sphaerisporangium album]
MAGPFPRTVTGEVVHVRGMVEPMLARAVDEIPPAPHGRLLFEPKWDGFRAIALVDDHGAVQLRSRRGARFGHAFPEVV